MDDDIDRGFFCLLSSSCVFLKMVSGCPCLVISVVFPMSL